MRTWSNTIFKEVLDRLQSNKRVLYVDSWGGHRDAELYRFKDKDVTVKVCAPGSTAFVQPLDVYCNRQWKAFAKKNTEHCPLFNYRCDQRGNVLRLQSLIYNQFQHPNLRPLWLCAWRTAGFDVPAIPFDPLKAMLFRDLSGCSVSTCNQMRPASIRCTYCKECLCIKCFYIDY